jgi:hypothetical protein
MRRAWLDWRSGLAALALLVPAFALTGAHAAGALTTLSVSSPTDTALRAAFTAANATDDDVVIAINVGTTTISLTGGALVYTGGGGAGNHGLTIQGHGVTINQMTPDSRVVQDQSGGPLTIDRTTISGGRVTDPGMPGAGGVLTNGNLTLTNSTITSNAVSIGVSGQSSLGGGVFAQGDVVMVGSTITDNTVDATAVADSTSFGGGIVAGGALTVTNSTFRGNQALNGTLQTVGGAALAANGALTVTGSTITDNAATAAGGKAIAGGLGSGQAASVADSIVARNTVSGGPVTTAGGGIASTAQVTVANSTVTENTANGTNAFGGGILADGQSENVDALTLAYADVTANSSPNGANLAIAAIPPTPMSSTRGPSFGVAAGQVHKAQVSQTLIPFGSVIAAPAGGGTNCTGFAATTSQGYNLADDASCNLAGVGDTQGAGANPRLGPLANNGGATATLLPDPTSPLLDAIPIASCQNGAATGITTDQRGVPRPQGSGCDTGAVEVVPALIVSPRFTG